MRGRSCNLSSDSSLVTRWARLRRHDRVEGEVVEAGSYACRLEIVLLDPVRPRPSARVSASSPETAKSGSNRSAENRAVDVDGASQGR